MDTVPVIRHQNQAANHDRRADPAAICARKLELNQEISTLITRACRLETEIETVQTNLKLGMMRYLSDDAAAKLIADPSLLEDERVMLQVCMAAISQGASRQISPLKLLRNDYKLKTAKLKLLKQHLANLQAALQVAGRPDASEAIVSTSSHASAI
jgi:hypothetical protein